MRGRKAPAAKKPKLAAPEDEPTARDRLLAAAGDLFYHRGIRPVGVDEVVAAADVAKMSLYRSFASKDELAAAYLRRRDALYWQAWDEVAQQHPGAPAAKLVAQFRALARKTARAGWRGCPFTNAATEFPEPDNPARQVAEANKRELRRRLRDLAREAGARDPDGLADQLVLLFEGAYASAQTFGANGPAKAVADAAEALLAAQLD